MINNVYFIASSVNSKMGKNPQDKKIYKEELDLFIKKYEKERNKLLDFVRGVPPEIYILKLIVSRYKNCQTKHTPVSETDKEIISCMISMNKEYRADKLDYKPRLRDKIVDKMIVYFELEHEVKSRYMSLKDYF